MPNLAIIESIKKTQPTTKISYIGSYYGLETKLLANCDVDFYKVHTGKFRRYFSFDNFIDLFKVPVGFFQSLTLIWRIKPDLVFSKGGFVSLPVVFAAACIGVPIVIHESDSIPGLTTRITAKVAKQVWADTDIFAKKFKDFKVVKLPIRQQLFTGDKQVFFTKYSLSSLKPTLLVMGGSLGAGVINDFVRQNLPALLSRFNVVHIAGRGKAVPMVKNGYIQFEYLDQELKDAYAAADLVLSRSGASALSEFSSLKKKAILVPLDYNQSRGEQILNATKYAETSAAEVILEKDLSLESFESALLNLENNSKLDLKDTNQVRQSVVSELLFSMIPDSKNKV